MYVILENRRSRPPAPVQVGGRVPLLEPSPAAPCRQGPCTVSAFSSPGSAGRSPEQATGRGCWPGFLFSSHGTQPVTLTLGWSRETVTWRFAVRPFSRNWRVSQAKQCPLEASLHCMQGMVGEWNSQVLDTAFGQAPNPFLSSGKALGFPAAHRPPATDLQTSLVSDHVQMREDCLEAETKAEFSLLSKRVRLGNQIWASPGSWG